jgi:RNA polymerase subunit RPABC4/transcription elongation factor Spt4
MKLGNVVLAIFLWLCIPLAAAVGGFFGIMGSLSGSGDEGVICCLAGPIILFILGLVVLISGSENTKKSGIATIKTRFCPACGHSIPFDSKICPFCKNDFRDVFSDEIVILEDKNLDTKGDSFAKFCPQCGVKLDGIPLFCFKCGYKLR